MAAIVAAITLCVIVAGPGGAIEHLVRPLVTDDLEPSQRLVDLAIGIPMAILLVPGLAIWAWGPALRPAGTALALASTAAVTVDLAVRGGLTRLMAALLVALWLLVGYQVATVRWPAARPRRRLALLLSVPACVAPWVVQAGRVMIYQLRVDGADTGDATQVVAFSVAIAVLLLLPVVAVRAFAPVAFAAAIGAVIYAVASLYWASPLVSLPRPLAALAIATLVAYVDTVRQLAAAASSHGDVDSDTTEAMR